MERKLLTKRDIYFVVVFILSLLFVSTFFYGGQKVEDEVSYGATTPTSSTSWTASSSYYDTSWSGSGTASSPYLITTPAELAGLAYRVDAGTSYSGKYFLQTADLNLRAHYWDPIGDYESFSGYYDGGGHTITNLIIDHSSSSTTITELGLFSDTSGATIKNITIASSYIATYVSSDLGFIVGCANYSIIENCHTASSNLIYVSKDDYVINAGGIAGMVQLSTIIRGCSNATDIKVAKNSPSGGSVAGGICGFALDSEIIDCYNEGEITSSDCDDLDLLQSIGGICGYVYKITFNGCYNKGFINGDRCAGGIVGQIDIGSCIITNCYNIGEVNGYYAGGIVALVRDGEDSITNCYNTGAIGGSSIGAYGVSGICGYSFDSLNIINCYNVGSVPTSSCGGIITYSGDGDYLSNNYYGGNCNAEFGMGPSYNPSNTGCTKITNLNTTSYAKSRSWYTNSSNWNRSYPWDFDTIWSISSSINNGYPYLNPRYAIKYSVPSQLSLSSSAPTSAEAGETVYIPSPTSRGDGYSFEGWTASNLNTDTAKYGNSSSSVSTHWANGSTKVNANYFVDLANIGQTVTLTANVKISSYTVNVIYGNGTSNRKLTLDYGESFNLPVPKWNGKEFQGWTISGTYNLDTARQGGSSNPTLAWSNTTSLPTSTYFSNLAIVDGATVTLTAQWAPGRYDITYDVNSSDAQYVGLNYALSGEDFTITADGGCQISFDSTYGIITIDGKNDDCTYGERLIRTDIDYQPNSMEAGHYKIGGSLQRKEGVLPAYRPHIDIYLDSYLLGEGSTEYTYYHKYTETNDMGSSRKYVELTIFPCSYTYDNTQYRVFAYDPNYSGDNTQQILYGDTPAMGYAIRPGYVLSGWNTRADGKGTTYGPDNIGTITSDITLYAQWELATYTVTFDGNGGTSELDRMDVEYLSTFGSGNGGELPLAEKEGYVFKGWYLSADSDEEVTASTIYTYTDNITLYAQWEETWYDYGVKPEGEGTESSPYLIALPEHLAWLTNQVAKGNETEAYCRQIANIDMSNTKNVAEDKTLEWFPIGTDSHPFKGNYNGNGYSLRITSSGTQSNYYGLFGVTENATIEKIYFIGNNFTSGRTSGGVIAYAKGSTIVKDSYIELSLQRKIDTSSFTFGAIIGNGESGSVIENCSLVYYNSLSTEYPLANGDTEIRNVVYRYTEDNTNFENRYSGTDFSGFSYTSYWTMPLPKNLTHLPTEEVTLDVIKTWAGE